VDEYGYPMLWPLLLKYVERHCNKWKAYYRAEKRRGTQIPLTDLPDQRAAASEEAEFVAVYEELCRQLDQEEQEILEARLCGLSLEEIAQLIGRSKSTVANRLQRIRAVMEAQKQE
jgi:RNA polymerase sigma factor (sigma-70 family)